MIPLRKLSPRQQRLYDMFSDGIPRTLNDIRMYLDEDDLTDGAIMVNITHLRQRLPDNLLIYCDKNTCKYCLVRTLANPYDGKS